MLTDNGLQADASKIDAIVEMTPPREIQVVAELSRISQLYGQTPIIALQCVSTFA